MKLEYIGRVSLKKTLHLPFTSINFLIKKIFLLFTIVLIGCQQKPGVKRWWTTEDSLRIVNEIVAHRAEADSFFRNDPDSPFNHDSTIHYEGIKWFPPDIRFYFRSRLYRYDNPETVSVFGTKGEERKELKYGYFLLYIDATKQKLNVYKFTPYDAKRYEVYKNLLSVWFTDETTGKETYEVGRYIEIGDENSDANHIYAMYNELKFAPYARWMGGGL